MNLPEPPVELHPLCGSALDALLAQQMYAEEFVRVCNLTNSATLEWALEVVRIITGA
jgi:hypothetical protein